VSTDDSDKARKAILARRARFVTAAVASVTVACDANTPPPHVCLSQRR
jgi:hypothetical protein